MQSCPAPSTLIWHEAWTYTKASPESAAGAIFDELEKGDEEIFPDPMSERLQLWAAEFAQEDYLRLVRRVTTYTGELLSEAGYTEDQPAEAEVTA